MKSYFAEDDIMSKANVILAKQRDLLLSRLMSGELERKKGQKAA